MKESLRYLQNAKEILSHVPIVDNDYADIKPVREAFGTAYLAMLEAINEALLKKGLGKRDLPKSIDGYRGVLRKYFGAHNGKLSRKFEHLYDSLHIAGYYRGLIYNANVIKEYLKVTREFINTFQ